MDKVDSEVHDTALIVVRIAAIGSSCKAVMS